jgi:hypothetical protein
MTLRPFFQTNMPIYASVSVKTMTLAGRQTRC